MQSVKLNAQETAWAKRLGNFEVSLDEDFEERMGMLECSEMLAESLLERGAIPEVRLKYFTELAYHLSDPRTSRLERFELRGISGPAIFGEGTALKYLKYFTYGADLPEAFINELVALKNDHYYNDDFVEAIVPVVKKYFTTVGSRDRSSFLEEIFKLCLDLGLELILAKQLRNRVMAWRV
ncbi:hypothetical protein [Spirosoma jeollabukense]